VYSKSIRINKESVDLLLLINHFTSELTTCFGLNIGLTMTVYIMYVIICERVLLIFCALYDVSIGCIVFHSLLFCVS
jgi:hypothetical protein